MNIGLILVLFCDVILASLDDYEPFHRVVSVSFDACSQRCDDNTDCLSVSYLRRFNLCKMYDVLIDESIKEAGTQVKRKRLNDISVCSGTCVKEICSIPRVDDADRYGNMYSVGSKVLFTCRHTDKSEVITCLPGGVWSNNTLFCRCGNPGDPVNGKFGPLARLNDTHAFLNISCDENYFLHKMGDILCEINTGIWHGLYDSCCDLLQTGNWTKIFSSPKNYNKGIVKLIKGEIGVINTCTTNLFRNETILSNWSNYNIKRINLTVISNNVSVASMLFSGQQTTNTSWFSIKTLISSSWSDLTPNTSVSTFSINGRSAGKRRWFVAKTAENNTCTKDIGWFVVTWTYYPCGDSSYTGHRILYAKNGTSSTFTQGTIGIADKFEVWIEQ